ncbi:MAG: hypothetical protein ACRDF4_04255, partial [Rhabdochlamydiaceae bacterium]
SLRKPGGNKTETFIKTVFAFYEGQEDMKIKDNPKLVLGLLAIVFVFALASALYLPGYDGGSTLLQTHSDSATIAGMHIVYVHYTVGDGQQNTTVIYYQAPCLHHN